MITVAVAGSTHRTVQCAQAVLNDPEFELTWVLTPKPKLIGRHQVLTINPVHDFSNQQTLSTYLIDTKISQAQLSQATVPDLLLVVDFGYYVPEWLLNLPKIAPLNIHPSALPRWRGSSPGQYILLYGDDQSAVTLMKMNSLLDQGPIIVQLPFIVESTWNQLTYYQHSFDLISSQLASLLKKFVQNPTQLSEQPLDSPTPLAMKITKADTFIEWEICQLAMQGEKTCQQSSHSTLLHQAQQHHLSWPVTLEHACRAFSPSPGLWTEIVTVKGKKRLKILECSLTETQTLELTRVQLEGQQPALWNQVKNAVLEA